MVENLSHYDVSCGDYCVIQGTEFSTLVGYSKVPISENTNFLHSPLIILSCSYNPETSSEDIKPYFTNKMSSTKLRIH